MQRLGEELIAINKQLQKRDNARNNKIDVFFFTSDALDFAQLKGFGKKIQDKYTENINKSKNPKVFRFKSISIYSNKQRPIITEQILQNSKILQLTLTRFKNTSMLTEKEIITSLEQGPIFENFFTKWKEILKQHEFKPSLIHTTYIPYANILYSLYIAKKERIPSFITPFLHFENIRYLKKDFFKILSKFDKIFACTNYEKEQLISKGIPEDNVDIIPMGVDISKFERNYVSLISQIYNIPEDAKVVLFCGYKNFEKGAISLLQSIPLIDRDINEKVFFVFIGPSTPQFNFILKELRKKNKDYNIINITPNNLQGYFDKKKIGLFQRCDVYCMPSRSEAYGISYLEAWACKKPVIAANIPAMREIIIPEKNGLLVEFSNIKEIADAIIYLLKEERIGKKMGLNGYNIVKDNNEWHKIANQILNHYYKIIDN